MLWVDVESALRSVIDPSEGLLLQAHLRLIPANAAAALARVVGRVLGVYIQLVLHTSPGRCVSEREEELGGILCLLRFRLDEVLCGREWALLLRRGRWFVVFRFFPRRSVDFVGALREKLQRDRRAFAAAFTPFIEAHLWGGDAQQRAAGAVATQRLGRAFFLMSQIEGLLLTDKKSLVKELLDFATQRTAMKKKACGGVSTTLAVASPEMEAAAEWRSRREGARLALLALRLRSDLTIHDKQLALFAVLVEMRRRLSLTTAERRNLELGTRLLHAPSARAFEKDRVDKTHGGVEWQSPTVSFSQRDAAASPKKVFSCRLWKSGPLLQPGCGIALARVENGVVLKLPGLAGREPKLDLNGAAENSSQEALSRVRVELCGSAMRLFAENPVLASNDLYESSVNLRDVCCVRGPSKARRLHTRCEECPSCSEKKTSKLKQRRCPAGDAHSRRCEALLLKSRPRNEQLLMVRSEPV